MGELYNYNCKILRWIDGDTLKIEVDLGFFISAIKTVRVYGLNAPEHNEEAGKKALEFARATATEGSIISVKSHKASKENEKYGRWLADIMLPDGRDFATTMIRNGMGVAYYGGKR